MTYAMTLDNSWELMTEEEMYDVNGGWTTYTGASAWVEITNMIANIVGWGGLSVALVKTMLAGAVTAASVVGALVAFASAIGLSASVTAALTNSATLGLAVLYTNMDGGFRSKSYGVFGFSLTLVGRI